MLYIVGVGTPILPKEVTMFPCTSWVWAQPYFKEGTLHTVCCGCEYTHTKKKPHMPYIVGVGSPTPFQDAESFSYMLYIMGMAMSIGQFANFECLVRTSFPRAYDQYSTPDSSEY